MSLPLDEPALWYGGFYELLLHVRPGSPARLGAAIRAAWSHPAITRCSGDRALTEPVVPGLAAQEAAGHLHGLAAIPGFATVVCGSFVFRDADVAILDVYLPVGALEHVDGRARSLWEAGSRVPRTWRAPLDAFLHDVGDRVQTAAPVVRREIGFDAL